MVMRVVMRHMLSCSTAVGKEVRGRVVVLGGIETGLNKFLALSQGHYRLKLRCGKGIDVTCLACDKNQGLSTS